jgi:cyclopropane-fatty-acyl-phospholipid synthase
MVDAAPRLHTLAGKLLGAPLPVRIRAWDGSEAGPPGAPVLLVRSRRALRRIVWRPGELGLARAWVAGEIDVDGDLYEVLDALGGLLWERDGSEEDTSPRGLPAVLRDPAARSAARELLSLAGPFPPPPPPREEVRRRTGLQHTLRRDKQAISTTTTSATTSTPSCSAPAWCTPAPTGRTPARAADWIRRSTTSWT